MKMNGLFFLGRCSTILFVIGIIEFLPIPNSPEAISIFIQKLNPIILSIGVLLLQLVLFSVTKRKYILFYISILFVIITFRNDFYIYSNKASYYINKTFIQENDMKLFLGMTKKIKENSITFSWRGILDSQIVLTYSPNHSYEQDILEREILRVYDNDWIETVIPLFE